MKKAVCVSLFASMLICGQHLGAVGLKEIVYDVVSKNSGVKSKMSAYKQDIEAYKIAKSEYYPSLDFDGTYGKEKTAKTTTVNDADLVTRTVSIVARQNIFNGFATENSIRQAKNTVYSSAYDYIGVANELAITAIELYFGIVKEQEVLSIEKMNYQIHEKIFDDIKKKYDSGLGKISDVKEVKSKLSLAYSNYIAQEQALNDKIIQFNALYGDFLDTTKLEKPNSLVIASAVSLRDLEESVVNNNPNIKMKEFALASAKDTNTLVHRGYYPKIDFELSKSKKYNQSGVEGVDDVTNAMFKFSYNLYNRNIDERNIQKSLSSVIQKSEELNTKLQEELKKARLYYLDKETIDKKMVHLNMYTSASKEKLISYREEFELGRRSLLDLLGAEDDYNNAQKQLIRAGYDKTVSEYKILYSMGKLLDTFELNIEQGFIKQDKTVDLEKYKEDALAEFNDDDGDKIENTKDLCFNSKTVVSVNSTGCAKTLDEFIKGTAKSEKVINDSSKEKDLTALNDISKINQEPIKNEVKKFRLKGFSFMRNSINGDIEYVWPAGIIIEGLISDKWVEVKKRLGSKGETLGEFKLWINSLDVEEI